eukprot:540904-Pyramimonas_sp.AAC.1
MSQKVTSILRSIVRSRMVPWCPVAFRSVLLCEIDRGIGWVPRGVPRCSVVSRGALWCPVECYR